MHPFRFRRAGRACATLAAVTVAACGATGASAAVDRTAAPGDDPVVTIDTGALRGAVVSGGFAFRGIPYAAPPLGRLRWHAPRPAASWDGVRDATQYGASCPQVASPFAPPAPFSESCLFLNVSTPTLSTGANRPVIVWIHGGGLTQDSGRDYEGTRLAADGTVVVTLNYRLGALGFLAHPALASRPGGPTGNYGLMDQQAALRWVQRNIARFGGDPHNVAIDGESAGGLSVLAHMVSRGSRGLFQRAIVQSGSFALNQQPLAEAEAAGEAFATQAGCPDQTAGCLRRLPVDALLYNGAAIPGVVDGKVLKEPIGTALAAGRFARVPLLNGVNHVENAIFVGIGVPVIGGRNVKIPRQPVTPDNYHRNIAVVFGASPARAAQIAAQYPVAAYPSAAVAFSILTSDAGFVCPAFQVDRWASAHVPTFAYEFDDDNAPHINVPPGLLPPVATHGDEIQYVLEQPNAGFPVPFTADQETLSATMRAAWASFAAGGDPSTAALPWPSVTGDDSEPVMSLNAPQSQLVNDSFDSHHCGFWNAG
jgi:para-nitrobenzyl esterase